MTTIGYCQPARAWTVVLKVNWLPRFGWTEPAVAFTLVPSAFVTVSISIEDAVCVVVPPPRPFGDFAANDGEPKATTAASAANVDVTRSVLLMWSSPCSRPAPDRIGATRVQVSALALAVL